MNKIILIILSLSTTSVFAKSLKNDWSVEKGKLTYHVKYVLKNVEGVSEAVKGKGKCEKGLCQFLIAAPVKTFMSGDGNRDNHMLEVTKGAVNPVVTVRVEIPETKLDGDVLAKVDVQFAGHSHTYENVKIVNKISGEKAHSAGQIPLVLTDFAIERPSLLGISIEDKTPVDFAIDWN